MLKKGTPASPATALANRVLPVPGGPTSKHALGDFGTQLDEFLGMLEKLDDLNELLLGLVQTCDVLKRTLVFSSVCILAGFAKGHGPIAAALHLIKNEEPDPHEDDKCDDVGQKRDPPRRWRGLLGIDFDALSIS